MIQFSGEQNAQTDYFEKLYQSGKSHAADANRETPSRTYQNLAPVALRYLELCGYDLARGLEGASVLDVACGTGWVTAGLIAHPSVRNCSFHAFDISPGGPEALAGFARSGVGSNRVEISVQDAEAMCFCESSFDLIIGSSALHHFGDPERFLSDCRRLLKQGGKATFGEPFAVGYGLGAAALMLAQRQRRKRQDAVTDLYKDILKRVKAERASLEMLVDKHLFLHGSFLKMAYRTGFRDVEFVPLASREYYRERFIHELLAEHGVIDPELAQAGQEIYRIFFDLFDTQTYGESAAAFLQLVLHA